MEIGQLVTIITPWEEEEGTMCIGVVGSKFPLQPTIFMKQKHNVGIATTLRLVLGNVSNQDTNDVSLRE